MPISRRSCICAIASLALFGAAACNASDDTPTYRYRLTVEVDTPAGVRSGSSVIEVEQRLGRPMSNPGGMAIDRRARGQAVMVDLPDGRTLFALLRSEDETDWASSVMQTAAPRIEGEPFEERFDNMLLIDGEVELPRRWPPVAGGLELAGWPMLVTFADLADPTSVTLVDPDDLAATFGEGVALRRITVEMTDDPVTEGIEERLGWLSEVRGALVDLPVRDYPPVGTPLPLHNTLTRADFEKEMS